MPDTQRSIAQVKALLADNLTQQISAQDVRDFLETIRAGHGEISVTASAETTIAAIDTWTDAAGTFALSGNAMNWDMNTNGQLRYIGASPRVAHIAISFSMTTAANNKNVSIGCAKNGTIITPSIVNRLVATGADEGTGAVHAFIDVTTNDYLTVQVRNNTDNVNMTLTTVNLFAMDMAI